MISCKQSSSTDEGGSTIPVIQNGKENQDGIPQSEQGIPRNDVPVAADFIDVSTMEEFLELEPGTIYDVVKNLNLSNKNSNSIFYQIDDPDLGNAAVMIQVTKNPLPDDISDKDYAAYYINNKVNEGERSAKNPEEPTRFEDWDVGVAGAYNKDLGKYYWRDKDHVIYLFATNVTLPIETQFKAAQKVAKVITPE
jgi:hypothetical protein